MHRVFFAFPSFLIVDNVNIVITDELREPWRYRLHHHINVMSSSSSPPHDKVMSCPTSRTSVRLSKPYGNRAGNVGSRG